MSGKMIKVQLYRSPIGRPANQKKILSGLGLKKLNRVCELPDTPAVRGMVDKLSHMVRLVD